MDQNSVRQNAARRAVGSPEDSIAAHGRKIESFNVEIRRNGSVRKRSLVLAASLGLHHASAFLGTAMACGGACCPAATTSSSSSTMLLSHIGVAPLVAAGLLCGTGAALVLVVNCASERHVYNLEFQRELWEIKNHIDGERQEMMEIYSGLGLDEREAATVTNIFAKDPVRFAALMMVEELGYARLPPLSTVQALLHAAVPTALGYAAGVVLPLVPLFLPAQAIRWLAAGPTADPGSEAAVAAHAALGLSTFLLVGGCAMEGCARATVFLGSYAEHRTRVLAGLSTLSGALTILTGAFCLVKLVRSSNTSKREPLYHSKTRDGPTLLSRPPSPSILCWSSIKARCERERDVYVGFRLSATYFMQQMDLVPYAVAHDSLTRATLFFFPPHRFTLDFSSTLIPRPILLTHPGINNKNNNNNNNKLWGTDTDCLERSTLPLCASFFSILIIPLLEIGCSILHALAPRCLLLLLMASAPSFSALPASWNSEKAASIDWENPADILFNGFTFLEMVAAHPALAAYYGMGAAAHGSTIPAERLEERQRAKHLFLHRVDPADIEKEGDNSGAAAAKVEASLTAAGGSRGRRGASSHGSAGTHLLKEVVLEKVRAAQEVRRAQCALLTRWAGEGLFQLRPERWCRYCGAPGHTARSCTQRHAAASGVRPAGSAEATALSIPAAVFENALLATSAEGCEEAQSEEASGGSAAASPGQKRGRDGTTRREEGGESAAAGMTVLQKFYAHQQRLEKHRLLDEKKKGNGGTQRSGRPGARGGERGAPRPELELFSDERRRGVVDRLDVSFNVGFVRVTGMAMDLKFFVDRSDCGVKRLQVGDKVTFKIDSSRDYPIAVDVRVEAPVITAGDVKAFMNQCRLAGQQTNSMELLSMIVSHTSEWQDVVRHVYALMLTHQQQQPQSQQEASSSNAAAPSWEPLPTWVSYVQHIIDLTTLHVNREPIHTSILVTFLKLLSSPVSQQIPPTATATATAAATTASSAEQSSTSISSSRGGPATTTSSSTAPIRFLPDLFSRAMTYWRDNVLPTVGLQQQQQRASTTRKTALDVSHSGGGGAPDVEERIAIMVDALCEATDLVVMARQYLAEFRSGKNFQPLYSILHNLLEEAVRAVASVPHLSGWSNVPNCTRRLRAAVVRLEKVDPSRSSFSSSSVAVIPTELELAVPPPYPTSLFNPSRLPVQRMANDPQYLLESKRRGAAAEEANDAGADTVFSPYASADSFITAHCQLLRADTFEATARLLAATCFQLPDYPPDAETKSDVEHAALYDQVRFMGRVLPRDRDYVYAQSYLFQVHPKSSQASLSKKLYQGACVCFVTALDPEHIGSAVSASGDAEPRAPPEIFWGTISSCDEKLLKAGIIVVSPCSTNPGGASVVPSFAELLSNLSRNAQQGRLDRCLMLETPIFYSGYAGIIQSLFTFLGPLAMPLPFGRRMIGPTDEENAAAIAAQKSNTTCKAHEGQDSAFPLGLGYIPPHCEQAFREIVDSIRNSCKLDAGQEEVMRVLPTRDIVLVQGPPGTGKSFIGCRVVEAYVRYKQRAASGDILQHISVGALSGGFPGKAKFPSPASGQQRTAHGVSLLPVLTPMVVITYKNHALDEFLVDLLHC
eukprot:gene2270-1413_t